MQLGLSISLTSPLLGGGGVSTPDLTVPFGAQTFAGAGAWQLRSGATALTNVTDLGTGTAAGYSLSSGGLITPTSSGSLSAQDGNTIDVSSDQGDLTVTLNITAGECSVISDVEADAVCDDATYSSAGGITIRFRDGASMTGHRMAKNRTYASPVVFTSDTDAVIDGVLDFEASVNITVSDMEVHEQSQGTSCVRFIGACDAIVEDCELHGTYRDPLGDYSSGNYTNTETAVRSVPGSSGDLVGITVRRCHIYNVEEGVVLATEGGGGVVIQDNEIYHTYSDAIKLSIYGSALTAGVNVSRNVIYNAIGLATDTGNPHTDWLQLVSSSDNDGLDMTNVVIEQNVGWQDQSAARGRAVQGIVAFDDGGNNVVLKDAVVRGNVMLMGAVHLITFQTIDGGTFENNTLVRPSDTADDVGVGGLNLGANASSGTVTVSRNIADGYGLTGSATFNTTDQITLGDLGATIAYDTVFADETSPTDYASVLTKKAMLASGPADLAGTPDAGAIGSSFAVFGDPRDPSGWSIDPLVDPATIVVSDGRLTRSATAGNEAELTLSMRITPDDLSGTQSLYRVSGRSEIFTSTDGLRLVLKDTANTTLLSTVVSSLLTVGVEAHLYIAANFATGTLLVEVDGIDVTPSGFSGGTGLTDFDRTTDFLLSYTGGVRDLFLDNSIVPNSSLWNGGVETDLASLSPLVLFGDSMTVADWNAGDGLGSVTGFTVTGTFTDVS